MPRTDSDRFRVTSGYPRPNPKTSSFHSFVYNHHGLPLHHLVPLSSERRVQPHPVTHTTSDSGRPSKSGIYEPFFTFPKVSADSGVGSISEENLSASEDDSDEEDGEEIVYPATMTLERSSYRESISFGVVEPVPQSRFLSVTQQETVPRMKETVIFGPGLKPVSYQNRMAVSVNSTWKRYKSTVHYEPKIRPVRYSSTCFIRPCYVVKRFVTLLDYGGDNDRKWFQSTMELRPTTYSSCKVNCFEMNNNELDEQEDSDDSTDDQDVSVFLEDGLVSPHIVNAKVWDYSDANTAPRSFRNSLSSTVTEPRVHRASIIVNGGVHSHSIEEFNDGDMNNCFSEPDGQMSCINNERFADIPDYKMNPVNGVELTTDVGHSEYGHTAELVTLEGEQQEIDYAGQGDMDYLALHNGLGKYVHLNGYGGSSGSLDEIDL